MEFLVDANVSYVLLILGFLAAILALFSPGTGILEIGALFALMLAGYGIANQPVNTWALGLLALSLLPFVFSLRRGGRGRVIFLGASVLIFLTGSALLFPWQGWQPAVHPALILLLSILAVGLAWLIASKSVEAMMIRPVFDPDRLVGMIGVVSSDIREEGSVYIGGEEWSARSRVFIPAGSRVRVLRREGLMLEVEPIQP
jgi:membrane-bound serine protease (ClpP class)